MRIVATDAFLDKVEKSVKNAKEDTSKINYEQDTLSDAEESLEHAKSYWMMGYTWEEIDAILEDMEYPRKIVDSAIKKTQEYAKEVLGDGPFGIKEGQLIKLSTGQVVKALSFSEKVARVYDSKNEIINVPLDLIDVEATKKLTEAFNLRLSAKKIFKEAQGGPKDPKGLVPMDTFMETKPKEVSETLMTEKRQAPRGWAPYFDETPLEDIPEASGKVKENMEQIDDMIKYLSSTDEALHEAKQSIKDAKAKLAEVVGERAEAEKIIGDYGKQIASILGFEHQLSDDLVPLVLRRFKNLLIAYREYSVSEENIPGPVDKFNALIEIVTKKAPELIDEINSALDEWVETNTIIVETIHKDVAIKEMKEKDLKKKRSQIIEKTKNWLSSLWDKVKGTYSKLTEKTLPELDALSDMLEEGLQEADHAQLAASVRIALKEYI